MVDRRETWSRPTPGADYRLHGVSRLYIDQQCCTDAKRSANDLRYLVALAATLKAGYVPLFTSPRNSLDGQKYLVEKTGCEIFLTTIETAPQVEAIREAIPHLRVFQAPTTQELLDPDILAPHYIGRQNRDVAARSLILHTSGSTGEYHIEIRECYAQC